MADKSATDADRIIARMGLGHKIACGKMSVAQKSMTDTTCGEIIHILNCYTHSSGTTGNWDIVRAYPSDTAGELMLEVYTTDASLVLMSTDSATDVHWGVIGTT